MTLIARHENKMAYSLKKQTAFGTPLEKTDITQFVKLAEPLLPKEPAEHWTDRGMVGLGHDWETQRGLTRLYIQGDLDSQPVDISFLGLLVALLFSDTTPTEEQTGVVYSHESKFLDLDTRPEAYVSTWAVWQEGSDYAVQDLALQSLTLRGEGSNRMEADAGFLASKKASISSYTWPSAAAARYIYNYAGVFTIDAGDKKAQVRSFELSLEAGINLDLAFLKVAAEADRIYPGRWLYTPDRNMSLSLSLILNQGDIATFRAAYHNGTEMALVLSCLGEQIPGSSPAVADSAEISIPKAVITEFDYDFGDGGLATADLTLEGHYDTTGGLNSPVKVTVTNGISAYFA